MLSKYFAARSSSGEYQSRLSFADESRSLILSFKLLKMIFVLSLSLVGDLLFEPVEPGDKALGERLQLLSAALNDLLGDPVVEQDVAYTLHEDRYEVFFCLGSQPSHLLRT